MTELFDIVPLRFIDLVDIGIVAFLLYTLYRYLRGTIAVHIFLGMMILWGLYTVVIFLQMTMLQALFLSVADVFMLAMIVLFQPEIRKMLLIFGQTPLVGRMGAHSTEHEKIVDEVISAVSEMSKQRVGALIAFSRMTGLRNHIETGTPLLAAVKQDLLTSIFFPKSPLHDGAVIIHDNKIAAARCILPVSHSMQLSPHLGLRHRAAAGLSEITDAFIVIVSEETGNISIAENNRLIYNISVSDLRHRLLAIRSDAKTSGNSPPAVASPTQHPEGT